MSDSTINPALLQLSHHDDVAVAVNDLAAGEWLNQHVQLQQPIGKGHKVALKNIAKGSLVLKYQQIIGRASSDIAAGEHVHLHNMEMIAEVDARIDATQVFAAPVVTAKTDATFAGIVREDGRVATRNYIAVLTTVNCSATVAQAISDYFTPQRMQQFSQVDGVVALCHNSGCAMDNQGEGLKILRNTIAGFAQHANFAACLIVGLGCEANQIDALLDETELASNHRLQTLNIQDCGGTRAAVEKGIDMVTHMLPLANKVQRQPVSAQHLTLALQCGGSDGFSGISVNPALGAAADLLVAHGGTVVLGETPEIYGAEHLLLQRAVSEEVKQALRARLQWWQNYTATFNGSMDNNPSPGNKAGGLTTILEKSLGAVAKAGTTPLNAVYHYAQKITHCGLVFMDTPGYDPVSVTGQVAGGANVVCFTTGRGSVFGCKPAPTLKLASNSRLYQRMSEDMDINCGVVLDGELSIEEMGRQIFAQILSTASGAATKSELAGFGDKEFCPWQLGAVM